MRSLKICLIWFLAPLLTEAQPCSMSGTYQIGPGGHFTTITKALDSLRVTGVGGPVVLELKSGYTNTAETFPLAFGNIPCVSAINNITLQPEAGATNLEINTNINRTIFSLANSRYITIDGRPGGTGTTSALTINAYGLLTSLIEFRDDASFNKVTYLNILSNTPNCIQFLGSTAAVTNGNSFNEISNCTIGTPARMNSTAVYSSGSDAKKNSANKILNCNFLNYYSAISLDKNSSAWEINGNSIYKNFSLPAGNQVITGIKVNDSTSSGFLIRNNFIGGSAPLCGGNPVQYRGGFTGITLTTATNGTTVVEGNTLSNHSWGNYIYLKFIGIELKKGKIDCGGVNGNTIGSGTDTAVITATFQQGGGDGQFFAGIAATYSSYQTGTDSFLIRNNKIGGIKGIQAATDFSESGHLYGILLSGLSNSYTEVSQNLIGSETIAKSIVGNFPSDSVVGICVRITDALYNTGSPVVYHINGNRIRNCTVLRPINVLGGIPLVKNNIIKDVADIYTGISLYNIQPGSVISGNKLQHLSCPSYGNITGIFINGRSAGVVVEKNLITGLEEADGAQWTSIYGIFIDPSYQSLPVLPHNFSILNNMISLGSNGGGVLIDSILELTGIHTPLYNTTIDHNSVYLCGTGIQKSSALYFYSLQSSPRALGINKVVNNILVNNYINSSNFNKILEFEDSIPANSDISIDNNIYHTTRPGTYLFKYQSAFYDTLPAWRAATGYDKHSAFFDPHFINPTGPTDSVDLHIASPSPVEGLGMFYPSVVDDFDGEIRSLFSPVDIGADAGNFIARDPEAPILTHGTFFGQKYDSLFEYRINITDNGAGVDSSASSKPRMWFKKIFPAAGQWFSTPGYLLSGDLKNGEWGFKPDLAGAGIIPAPGDSLAYYFAAQDKGNPFNIGYSNTAGASHANVNSQLTPPLTPLTVLLYGILQDTIYVGTGQQFTTLTGTNGLFHATKSYLFKSNNITKVLITSDLSEPGIYDLEMTNNKLGAVTIAASTAVTKKIQHAGDLLVPMIRLKNCHNIIIDGSVSGAGRYLEFINGRSIDRQYGMPAISVTTGAYNFSLLSCIIRSNSNYNTIYLGNDYIYQSVEINCQETGKLKFINNHFTSIENGPTAGLPETQLTIKGTSNDSLIISNNDFTNFKKTGLRYYQLLNTTFGGPVVIDGNHFYYNSGFPSVGSKHGIDASSYKSSIKIVNNFVGGSSRNCGGIAWQQNDVFEDNTHFFGIYSVATNDSVCSIQNNVIQNIRLNRFYGKLSGIACDGACDVGSVTGNLVGKPGADSSIVCGSLYGIGVSNPGLGILGSSKLENNTVTGVRPGGIVAMNLYSKLGYVKNNVVSNITAANGSSTGITVSMDSGFVTSNSIYSLYNNTNVSGFNNYGIEIKFRGMVTAEGNKIYDLRSNSSNTVLAGIAVSQTKYVVLQNNMINLSNQGYTNSVNVRGISISGMLASTIKSRIYYNTVRISGIGASAVNSYGVYCNGAGSIGAFKNNLIYNQRTGGGAKHLAIGMLSTVANPAMWPPGCADNNLYITADTSVVNEWRSSGAVSLAQWRLLSQTDSGSNSKSALKIPADLFFTSPVNNDLHINSSNSLCWYVNEKAIPILSVDSDFDSTGTRSIDVVNGKCDIGADEFVTNTSPPPSTVSLCAGGSSSITTNIAGTSYQWQLNTGSGFFNISNDLNQSGTNSNTILLNSLPSAWYGYQYRCLVDGIFSDVVALEFINIWTGNVNEEWSNPGNWSCGVVPDGNTDVTINSGIVVLNTNGICRSIAISPAASFIVSTGSVLTITH